MSEGGKPKERTLDIRYEVMNKGKRNDVRRRETK
jgi:hypothetical protein